jgi:mannose-6-phosphate isomerase-like protein (cupin superfamily)
MHKTVLGFAAVVALSQGIAFAQSGPKEAIDITHAQVEAVLKAGAARTPPAVDQTLRVIDMGTYAMSVAVIHRGATQPAGGGRGAAGGGRGAAPANADACGLTEAPAGAQMSPPGMIAHDKTVETYIVISGSGTLITGGEIVNGRRSGPDSEVTKILNGPSCSGRAAGNIVMRKMVVGDISVIPAGVPHGWTDVADHVDYLSIRPDPDKVLEHGYVNPTIAGGK